MASKRKTAKKGMTTLRPTGKPKNHTALAEMQCSRCLRMIQPGSNVYLLAHMGDALLPATPVACSSECRERWFQKQGVQKQGTTAPTATPGTSGQILTNRPQLRDGKQPRPFGPIEEPKRTDAEDEAQLERVARQKPISSKAVEIRTETREGQEFTVYVLPERKTRKRKA